MQSGNSELVSKAVAAPNPKRVAAGRLNRAKRKGLTPEGREQLRRAALTNQPWSYSTGPRTAAGKATAAANGKKRQCGLVSVRELRADLRKLRTTLKDMADARRSTGV
jgi:hypothetical protein